MPARANRDLEAVLTAVRTSIDEDGCVVLAVSGGRDSMVLLDAAVRVRRAQVAAVATFDHGTGAAARAAVVRVKRACAAAGVPVVAGRARGVERTEAAWRSARMAFLRETAESRGARLATAHTRDDQLETVVLRALRGAGPRGLAGLYAGGAVLRPLLDVSRDSVTRYAAAHGVEFADDPTNRSRQHARNRVRLDLLPALEAAHPGFGAAMLATARRAADWRRDVERFVDGIGARTEIGAVYVGTSALAPFDARALAVLWPAIAARAGIALDRRGTERLSAFTNQARTGGRIQLAGGHEVVRHRHAFEVRAGTNPPPRAGGLA